jgi:putative restriction endonuclease
MSDDALRASCFASLAVLSATHGEDVPYRGGLNAGFAFRGGRVPFLSPQKGIFRAAAQEGTAALSINTSANSPYDDEETPDGFFYAYRAGSIDQPDNRALRAAYVEGAPLVYFVATRPGFYKPVYPVYVIADDAASRRVLVSPGRMIGPVDELDPAPVEDPIERRYAVRETRVRLHQARFRGRVLIAYSSRCTICRLKETRLLDAAHIAGDLEIHCEPIVSNGLSLCSIHHRAFDENLVGISPDYKVHVARQLLEDQDGPMLELLKTFHARSIDLPKRSGWHPDQDRLADRFEQFQSAAAL